MATGPFLARHTVAVDQRGYFPGRHPRGHRLPRLRRRPARRSVPSPTTTAEWRAGLAASQSSRPLRSASVLVTLHSWPAARPAPAAPEGSSVNSEENHEVGVTAPACADARADGPAGAFKPAGLPLRATARSVRAGAGFVRSSVLGGADACAPAALSSGAACRTEVVAALRALPAEYSSVIVETFYRGRNVPETADVLGVSADMVKARCYDALHALKHALAGRGLTA
jgi:hypothetical protein